MNFFNKQLLHHSIFVDIRNNVFLLSGPTVVTVPKYSSTLWFINTKPITELYYSTSLSI